MSESESLNHWQISCEFLGKTEVFVDGVRLKGIRSVSFKHVVNDGSPIICLEIIPESVNAKEGEELEETAS